MVHPYLRRRSGEEQVTYPHPLDETGFINLVIWDRVFQAYLVVAQTASLLGVTGTIESKEHVVHLIAERLGIPRSVNVRASIKSRDFH